MLLSEVLYNCSSDISVRLTRMGRSRFTFRLLALSPYYLHLISGEITVSFRNKVFHSTGGWSALFGRYSLLTVSDPSNTV